MYRNDNDLGCGGIIVMLIIIGVMMAIVLIPINRAEDRCRARGGDPLVDAMHDVHCLHPKEGK